MSMRREIYRVAGGRR